MIKELVLMGALLGVTSAGPAMAQTPAAGQARTASPSALGTVHLSKKVMADGKPLAAGTYQVRLSDDEVKPAVGQAPGSERWVEFVKGGKVAGREVASVIGADDIGSIAKGKKPKANSSAVETLKGGDYVRVWINKSGQNYLINLPPAS